MSNSMWHDKLMQVDIDYHACHLSHIRILDDVIQYAFVYNVC